MIYIAHASNRLVGGAGSGWLNYHYSIAEQVMLSIEVLPIRITSLLSSKYRYMAAYVFEYDYGNHREYPSVYHSNHNTLVTVHIRKLYNAGIKILYDTPHSQAQGFMQKFLMRGVYNDSNMQS